jgi:methylphosphotriester-DNA--protein-cysteine methyltransferase
MMTKVEMYKTVDRFMADKNRVISMKMLCVLAGISKDTFVNVFKHKTTPLTPTTQIRLERAFEAIERGEVAVTQKWDRTRHVHYQRKAEPQFKRGFALTVRGGRIAVKTGLVNANCYRGKTFSEELEDTWPS